MRIELAQREQSQILIKCSSVHAPTTVSLIMMHELTMKPSKYRIFLSSYLSLILM